MENNINNSIPSENIASSEKQKITFANRYIHIAAPHNRINRTTFFLNVLILNLLFNFLPSSIFITIALWFFYLVQVTKRFHDFWKSWRWTAVVILYRILLILGPYIYFIVTTGSNLSWTFAYVFFTIEYNLYITIASVIPDIILFLIPGDKEENQYGKPHNI